MKTSTLAKSLLAVMTMSFSAFTFAGEFGIKNMTDTYYLAKADSTEKLMPGEKASLTNWTGYRIYRVGDKAERGYYGFIRCRPWERVCDVDPMYQDIQFFPDADGIH